MDTWRLQRRKVLRPVRGTDRDLGPQVLPLVGDLAFGHGHGAECTVSHLWHITAVADAGPVESVPATGRLVCQDVQIGADRRQRLRMFTEAHELTVAAVPPGATCEHRLGEEGLPPAPREALTIQVFRMK